MFIHVQCLDDVPGPLISQARTTEVKHRDVVCTPWMINIEPENDGLEDDFPFPAVYSQVPC